MSFGSLNIDVRRLFDIRPGEGERVALMGALLFFLLAANNVIKIVRDSLFLSRFPISQLPYVYLLAALLAAGVISAYSRYVPRLPFARVMLGSLVMVVLHLIAFWLLIEFSGAGWVLYLYYMWSAIVGLILIAQFWTLAGEMFTARDGKRLFGIVTAGGTLGGMFGGIMANWAVSFLFTTNHLLWFVVALLAGAYGIASLLLNNQKAPAVASLQEKVTIRDESAMFADAFFQSRYLQLVGAVIFVSVIVSTLIDYQFKATAKAAYISADALAGFFGSYYGWLSLVTLFAQLFLTGKVLTTLGVTTGLLILPAALLGGSMGILLWPGLAAATAARLTEASLRTSVQQSGVQILYLPVPDSIKKKVKVFMDVTVERLGDAVAAILILLVASAVGWGEITALSYFCIGLIIIWVGIVLGAHKGYVDTLLRSLAHREVSLDNGQINFADAATIEAVLGGLERMDEPSILFSLDLAEKMDRQRVLARIPSGLLTHESAVVRRRALDLVASSLDPNVLVIWFELLTSEQAKLRTEAINSVAAVLQKVDVPAIRPLLKSPEASIRRTAIRLMWQSGGAPAREEALAAFHDLLTHAGQEGEQSRVEASRLMGELADPVFSDHLRRLMRDDASPLVVREAMLAAGLGKYRELIPEVISRLGDRATKAAARESLLQYGEQAARNLRSALFDSRISREIRRSVPRTLSKIHAQWAMNALQAGLLEEERSIRFEVILALKEMARRFPDLSVDRQIVESAVMSDAQLYFRRFVIAYALFGNGNKSESLLFHALAESMERVRERVMWLLSLLYPGKDLRPAWSGLNSPDPFQRAYATEFLDNLLAGSLKTYVFPLYSDGPPDQRLHEALSSLGLDLVDADAALHWLLSQDDRWLKAAAIWEIAARKLAAYREPLLALTEAQDDVLREAATVALERMRVG
jgi:ATP/ADP translocase